ncbi:probable RNA helicase armi [Diorhabda sublineata]|uniref:probable RNA helicase armi n=1 Tax=Diorhabda sublineata TaxID=1163346 RepID=UPI0024E12DC0|nr:probable RNA helicase armi [Diorhabda sublineata]
MGNYISVLLGYNQYEQELSLENACEILHHVDTNKIEKELSLNIPKNFVSSKIGTITDIEDDQYIIDDTYKFTKTKTNFFIGTKVKFNLFSSDNVFHVSNVETIDEWDLIEAESDSVWTNRIIVCQVLVREGRKLNLTNNITLNLDTTPLEFSPIPGDWLELDVKCIVNEKVLDLSGNIIEINKVSPLRFLIEIGKITCWRGSQGTGTVNNRIYFDKSSLCSGYEPIVGDKVAVKVIESEQQGCHWRATKILPERLTNNHELYEPFKYIPNCKDSYPGLRVSDVDIRFEKLWERKIFEINILNSTNNTLMLISVDFIDKTGQCRILNGNKNIELLPESQYNIICECNAKNVGDVKEYYTLDFGNFTLIKYCNITVSIDHSNKKILYEYNVLKPHEESHNEIIKGAVKYINRFKVSIPAYSIPKKLLNTPLNEITECKPCLIRELSYVRYADKFHTLLYLEEIFNLMQIRRYDMNRANFIKNCEYLMLEIDNLSERRPSLIIGDKIIANDTISRNNMDYEGYIHKIGSKHIYLKFNQMFHDSYKGEDYSIKVVPSRSAYRKWHHAVDLAVHNLGKEILFPNKIVEKEKQVDFFYSKSECKREKPVLEWYNKDLNTYQKNAIVNILWGIARPLPYIIYGPPGTGKTVTVIETILQILRLIPSSRILVAAPSNSAADYLALKLIDSGVLKPGDLVRVISYNYATNNNIPFKLIPYCATSSLAKEDTTLNSYESNGIRFECDQASLGRHRVTVCTCSACGQFFHMKFPRGHFSHIVIDEAAQTSEPDIMIPMSFLDKSNGQVILAGDPKQLEPVVLCKESRLYGLCVSYIVRLINKFPYARDLNGFPETFGFDPRLVTKLLYNYRSLPEILYMYNELFYYKELVPMIDDKNSYEAKLLQSIQEILPKNSKNTIPQIVFHGVNGENYQSEDSPSWFNPHEAVQVFYYINELYRLGIKSSSIGIITPYIKQVKEIRNLLTEAEFELPKIATVEEIQGQEFDIVIISIVRSSENVHDIGFITPQRLNVAISRAKCLLIIIGKPNILKNNPYWNFIVNHCFANECYRGCDFYNKR